MYITTIFYCAVAIKILVKGESNKRETGCISKVWQQCGGDDCKCTLYVMMQETKPCVGRSGMYLSNEVNCFVRMKGSSTLLW